MPRASAMLWQQRSKALSGSSGHCLDLALKSRQRLITSAGGIKGLIGL